LKRLIKQNSLNWLKRTSNISVRCNISANYFTKCYSKSSQQRSIPHYSRRQLIYNGLIDATAKIKKAQTKTLQQQTESTYTNSDPESISCISRPFC
jgi:hypothetical protein